MQHLRTGAALCAAGLLLTAAAAPRQVIDLDQGWLGARVKTDVKPPFPAAGLEYSPTGLPSFVGGHALYLTRELEVPEEWRGKQVILTGEMANYRTRIRLDGQDVAEHTGAFGVFDIDLTPYLRFGAVQRLELCINGAELDADNRFPDALSYGQSWVWGAEHFELAIVNPDHIVDFFIRPEPLDGRVRVELALAAGAEEGAELRFTAFDAAGHEAATALLPATGVVELDWDLPHWWSPDHPYLYTMRIELLRDGQVRDRLESTFGYRDFRAVGSRFQLNGRRINLRGDGWHNRSDWSEAQILELFGALRAAGINIYRGHGPHPRRWFELADRTGMLLVAEGPTHQLYRDDIDHPDYDANARRSYTEWVRMVRNHPSLVLYSADNEVLNGEGNYQDDVQKIRDRERILKKLFFWADTIRAADPTRPIMHEGDGALDGRADIVNMHYPHEMPFWPLVPQDTWWLRDDPAATNWKYATYDWTKPLYIGEFSKSYDISPRSLAFWCGDAAYGDNDAYLRANGEIIREAVLGLRLTDCAGIAPWNTSVYAMEWPAGAVAPRLNPMYHAMASGLRRELFHALDYGVRLYGGQTAERRIVLFNDSSQDKTYPVSWQLRRADGSELVRATETLTIPTGERATLTCRLPLPVVTAPEVMTLTVAAPEVPALEQQLTVYPHAPLAAVPPVYYYGGTGAAELTAAGLALRPLDRLEGGAPGMTVLVAPDALTAATGAQLEAMARAGAQVVILRQSAWPEEFLDVRLATPPAAATMAFAHAPVVGEWSAALSPDLFRWWAPDNIVCDALLIKPESGALFGIVDAAGNALGLPYAAVLQGRYGAGSITLCQLPITEKIAMEPAAAVALAELLRMAPTPERSYRTLTAAELAGGDPAALRAELLAGGRLLLLNVTPDTLAAVNAVLGTELELIEDTALQGAIVLPGALPGLSDADLCFVVFDEWGCEYRWGANKRWPLVRWSLDLTREPQAEILVETRPTAIDAQYGLAGMQYGDAVMSLGSKFSTAERNDPALVRLAVGSGQVVISQFELSGEHEPEMTLNGAMRWEQGSFSIDAMRRRLRRSLDELMRR